jgi:CHASE3 domain sensor protein
MNDDRVVRLLEEIRDGQRALLEQYQHAIRNQQQSIEMQRSAMARPRGLLIGIGIVILVVLAIALVLLRYVVRTYGA